jgi:tRNA pseudouridine38-40 synthase
MAKGNRRRPNPRLMSLSKAPKDHIHVGLCLVYSGVAFRGLQLQAHSPTCHTVEGVLVQALKDAELITDVVRGRPEGDQHHFARACRTDRGVHAIRNMISLFLHKDVVERVGGLDGACAQINAHLPPMVRVVHAMLLAGNFIPRHCCNRRVYRYMLPLYALLPPCDTWAVMEKLYPGCFGQLQKLAGAAAAEHRALHGVPYVDVAKLAEMTTAPLQGGGTAPEASQDRSWVRETQEKLALCNRVLASHFTGSRRYHNFSVDVDSNRSSVSAKVVQPDTDEALRVIYRCEVHSRLFFFPCASRDEGGEAEPPEKRLQALHGPSMFEYVTNVRTSASSAGERSSTDTNGNPDSVWHTTTEASLPLTKRATSSSLPVDVGVTVLPFVVFQIEGGSFLLNMIRKIVGSLLAVCRGARESILTDALNPERRVTTPLAPGPYLYLAQSTYHGYDRSLGGLRETRLSTVQDAWAGEVDSVAERFAFHDIAADVVDADLNALPPLDDMLAARDAALAVRRPQTSVEDTHLSEMKEYKPVLPSRLPWPACGEMTVFLRLLRVHNWNVRPIRLDQNCKALKEVRNREERAMTAAAVVVDASLSQKTEAIEGGPFPSATLAPSTSFTEPAPTSGGSFVQDAISLPSSTKGYTGGEAEVPDGGTDGWLYLADSAEEAALQRQSYFASRWKRARPWEFAGGDNDDEDADGGEDDVDDDDCDSGDRTKAAHSRQKQRRVST